METEVHKANGARPVRLRKLYAVMVCLLCCVAILCCGRHILWVEYVPVMLVPYAEPYIDEFPELAHDSHFLDAAEVIFVEYNESYRRDKDTIYIMRRLARDTDLLANYSQKALSRSGREMPVRREKGTKRHLDFSR